SIAMRQLLDAFSTEKNAATPLEAPAVATVVATDGAVPAEEKTVEMGAEILPAEAAPAVPEAPASPRKAAKTAKNTPQDIIGGLHYILIQDARLIVGAPEHPAIFEAPDADVKI